MSENAPRIAEEYPPWALERLVQPHTLGRSFYMRPSSRSHIGDKEFVDNFGFWTDVLAERITTERNVFLRTFNVFDWVPYDNVVESVLSGAKSLVRIVGSVQMLVNSSVTAM